MVEFTCLPPRLLEKPGGSGMLDAAFEGRGIGEFNATTHCGGGGGGRRACDIIKEIINVVWGGEMILEESKGTKESCLG